MDNPLHRIKESLLERRQNLTAWLRQTPQPIRKTHVGPIGERAVEEQLAFLDTSLKKVDDKTLGLCEVCHDYVEESRLEMDYAASVCIEHLTGHERARLESDLELSQKVQRALLPQDVPEIPGVDIAAFFQPAHIVGGDYFDFFRYKDGSHGFVVADVMGKGMAASLLMASFQASLRIIAPESIMPDEVVGRLNHLFRHNIRLTKFVTVFLGRFDDSGALWYCNAGHNPPLLARTNGSIERLEPTGAAIGLVEQAVFENRRVSLSKGDRLLCYTDGVVEARNGHGNEFGMEGIEKILHNSTDYGAGRIVQELREDLKSFINGSETVDDVTILSLVVR